MKKQLTAIFLGLAFITAPQAYAQQAVDNTFIELNKLKYGADLITVGSINVNVSEKIFLKPDTAEFSIKYLSEGKTPTEASENNIKNMNVLTSYLQQLGIKKQDLTTIGYRNYDRSSTEPLTTSNNKTYQTLLTVNIAITNNQFYKVVSILEKQSISNIDKVKDTADIYRFTIKEVANSYDISKQQAEKKYQTITEQLNTIGINQITVEKYNNQEDEQPTKTIKTYYVENTLKIRTHQFDDLGKIIAKAEELKMNVNNDFLYSVSDENKNKAIAAVEAKLLAKLQEKAQNTLSGGDYLLGAPQNLNIFNSDAGGIYPQPIFAKNDVMVMGQGQVRTAEASPAVNIQAPSEFEIVVTMNGNFDILKKTYRTP